MSTHPPGNERRVDGDGVARTEQRSAGAGTWILGGAILFTVLCLAVSAWLTFAPQEPLPPPPEVQAPPAALVQPPPALPSPARASTPTVTKRPAPPPVAAPEPAPEPEPEQATEEPEWTDSQDGEPSGMKLFPAPGTKPIKRGLVVPEDFELPPGYVRHYQATDDGERVKPILMFHPNYQPRDATGQPVPMPEDRIVPAALAPPGMPLELLEPTPVRKDAELSP